MADDFRIPGKRVKSTRWVHTHRYIVAVEVEGVIPADDPSDLCYEPWVTKLVKQVQERAEAGDVSWLRQHGRVFTAEQVA